ncbi:type I 3-dehydroquinate dehydratase [Georgenia satyanarayanai]|uniref:type I 3-dehydroquinate dehydratase n=1 Tax=Georgenia satyanarayanai TaxID=860221 RepID=UPI00203EAD25|nr:type I 3-dehydroquinate dehydratase [Georgenia satyanarayanai]MCM3660439.1 type I 3-dehydroquinate dehydratase [Georgenia satyanarayanai]
MSGVVRLRDVAVGEGRVKIAASLCSPTAEGLFEEAGRVTAAGVDIAEWRADHLLAARPDAPLRELPAAVRARLGAMPLLLTVRSAEEGGKVTLDDTAYATAVSALLDDGSGDAVDLELARGSVLAGLVDRARETGARVVVSSHDVTGTPPLAEMVDRLAAMAATGADVVKIAVTAQDPLDVIALLEATCTADRELDVPVVTMAMGPVGLVSRLCGEVFGSAVTFGSVDSASAPGQIDVGRLRDVVGLVHEHTAR